MIQTLIIRLRGAGLMVLLALALASAGFVHHAPSQNERTVQAFLAAGFALEDLCGTAGGDASAFAATCLVCNPPVTPVIAGNLSGARQADLLLVLAVDAPRARATVPAVHDPARPTRAPPLA